MGRKKGPSPLVALQEAKADLKELVQLDLIAKEREEDLPEFLHKWIDKGSTDKNIKRIHNCFKISTKYLSFIRKGGDDMDRKEIREGVLALRELVESAAFKIDEYLNLFMGDPEVTSAKEMKAYKAFKRETGHFLKRYQSTEEDNVQLDDLVLEEDSDEHIVKKVTEVVYDKAYELMFMRTEEGRPYYESHLISHLRKFGSLDQMITALEEEDPLLEIPKMQNHEIQLIARSILDDVRVYIDALDETVSRDSKIQKHPFVYLVYKMLFSLMMSASEQNLLENSRTKSCILYFSDFQKFLRQCFAAEDYKRVVKVGMDEVESWMVKSIHLLQIIVYGFFAHLAQKEEMTAFIESLIAKGHSPEGHTPQTQSLLSNWEKLVEDDLKLRECLSRNPSGPVWRSMDLIREGTAHLQGYDPLGTDNYPSLLYNLNQGKKEISIMRIPSPTKQSTVEEVEVSSEFRGFLDYLTTSLENQNLLIFNLQNRNSWKEHARANVLESLQERIGYKKNLTVVSLPKSGDFYEQTDFYENIAEADKFRDILLQQVMSGGDCGFYFPSVIDLSELHQFAKEIISIIAELFFMQKKRYSRDDRFDFIEIFHLFLTLKITTMVAPDAISFMCKDGVDRGIASSAALFGFIKELSNHTHWSDQERKFLYWMLYAPALQVRERAIQKQVFDRMVRAMERIHDSLVHNRAQLEKRVAPLFDHMKFSHFQVKEAS